MNRPTPLVVILAIACWPCIAFATDFGQLAVDLLVMAVTLGLLCCLPVLAVLSSSKKIGGLAYSISTLMSAPVLFYGAMVATRDSFSNYAIYTLFLLLLIATTFFLGKLTYKYWAQAFK